MAEEIKPETKNDSGKKIASTIFKVLLGLVFLTLGAYWVYLGRFHLLDLIKGSVGLFFVLAGIITLAIAKE